MNDHKAEIDLFAMTHRAIADTRKTVAESQKAVEETRRSIESTLVNINRSRAIMLDGSR